MSSSPSSVVTFDRYASSLLRKLWATRTRFAEFVHRSIRLSEHLEGCSPGLLPSPLPFDAKALGRLRARQQSGRADQRRRRS